MTTIDYDLQQKASDLVRREVHYCVSYLVSTLAKGYGDISGKSDLGELSEQAIELCSPIPDYEEAAIREGWSPKPGEACGYVHKDGETSEASTWEELCDEESIDPYDREVYEHWIVSDWLAGKLEDHGEKIDRDFARMTVWARTTTGQAISIDYVIEQITKELHER